MNRQKEALRERKGERGGRDAGRVKGESAGVGLVELTLIAVLNWERRFHERVCAALVFSVLGRRKFCTAVGIDS